MAYAEALGVQIEQHARILRERAGAVAEASCLREHEPHDLPVRQDASGTRLGVLILVEHEPVITVSRRKDAASHVVASAGALEAAGVRVEATDRGGDVTYHGPGQLVCYPIVDLNRLGLRLHGYMRALEGAIIETCAAFGVETGRDAERTGVWIDGADAARARKIAALGVRVKRWVTMHGLALNVTTDLSHFDLIVPCGIADRGVTSLERELGPACPPMAPVKRELVSSLERALAPQKLTA